MFNMDRWLSGARHSIWTVFWIYNITYGTAFVIVLVPLLITLAGMLAFHDSKGAVIAFGCLGLALAVFLALIASVIGAIWAQKAIVIAVERNEAASQASREAWREVRADFGRHFGVAFVLFVISFGGAATIGMFSVVFAVPSAHDTLHVAGPRACAPRHLDAAEHLQRRGGAVDARLVRGAVGFEGVNYERFFSRDAQAFRPSAIRAFAKYLNDPNVISFAGGSPNPETFPAEEIGAIAERVVRERRHIALQYGPTRGLPRLCAFIASLCGERGIDCTTEDVIVTTGSQQALDLVAHTLLDPGDTCWSSCRRTSAARRRSTRGARSSPAWRRMTTGSCRSRSPRSRRGRGRSCCTSIPNFQNPSGRLMTQERRARVLEIARRVRLRRDRGRSVRRAGVRRWRRHDADEVTRHGRPRDLPRVVLEGARARAPLRLHRRAGARSRRRLEIAKQAADLCSGMLDQSIVDEFCAGGALRPQIEKVRAFYRGKRATLLDALRAALRRSCDVDRRRGRPVHVRDAERRRSIRRRMSSAPSRNGVAFIPGAPFFVDGSGRNTMRLTFAKEGDVRIVEGVEKLAGVRRA